MLMDAIKQKTRINTRLDAGSRTVADFLEHVHGGDRWI
jgi:hypothetical protein